MFKYLVINLLGLFLSLIWQPLVATPSVMSSMPFKTMNLNGIQTA
uniref:Uncharacterized protein n=1 Tax=Anguilla anguilla TaxID=7936 RepID=A0A0E9V8M9_ANGAN